MVTSEQAAYMAGALDGEGHLAITKRAADRGNGRSSDSFSFAVTVTNTNKPWLDTLQQWFGGVVQAQGKARDGRRRECYILRFRRDEAARLLIAVQPYLVMKRRQAALLQEFWGVCDERAARARPSVLTDAAIVTRQRALYDEVRSLNLSRPSMDHSWRTVNAQCSVDGCERKHYGKGYCWMHYRKYVIRGGPARYERSCEVCRATFIARRSDTVTCSKACGDKRYYAMNTDHVKAQVADYKRRMKAASEA